MKKFILLIVFLLIPVIASALTSRQQANLELAYSIGEEYGWPETAQILIMQESLAGELPKFGDRNQEWEKRSYGLAHMTLKTAKYITEKHFKHPVFERDEDIIVQLLVNDRFAIHMAMWYFMYLLDYFDGNWTKALLAYNVGPAGAESNYDPNDYVKKCIWRLKNQIRPFNHDSNIRSN